MEKICPSAQGKLTHSEIIVHIIQFVLKVINLVLKIVYLVLQVIIPVREDIATVLLLFQFGDTALQRLNPGAMRVFNIAAAFMG